jgi:RND superfamily putative drug exporter
LSGGATQLGNGVSQAGGGTSQLRAGLSQASGYLHDLSRLSGTAGLNTFYMPANRLNDPQFTLARYYSLSSDGTTARFLVLGRDDPFGDVARNRIALEQSAVNGALSGTTLAGARVLVAGDAALRANLSGLFGNDFTVVAVAVMLGVFIVLVLLLRSLVAPFYLLLSVLLSPGARAGRHARTMELVAARCRREHTRLDEWPRSMAARTTPTAA